jgi:hypothetical protein
MQRLIEIHDGTAWTSVLDAALARDGVTIERGRQDEASAVDPAECSMTLIDEEQDGRYNPYVPTSPLYGLVGTNTPLRVALTETTCWLTAPARLTGAVATTPDNAAYDVTDLDVRMDLRMHSWRPGGSGRDLCARWTITGNQRSWVLQLLADGRLKLTWSPDGTTELSATSTAAVPETTTRATVRVTLDVNNGAGGHDVAFYLGTAVSSPWTQLGTTITGTGTTAIYGGSAGLDVGDAAAGLLTPMRGLIYAFQMRNGLVGTIVANPDFTIQAADTTSFTDSAGRVWTIGALGEITNRHTRIMSETPDWGLQWHPSGHEVTAPLESAGVLRRLGQGKDPLKSALTRYVPTTSPVAYWPLEDGQGATRSWSPISGVSPMLTSGLEYGADDSLVASEALPSVSEGAKVLGRIPGHTTTSWTVQMVFRVDEAPAAETALLDLGTSGGSVTTWRITLDPTYGASVYALDRGGLTLDYTRLFTAVGNLVGRWMSCELTTNQNGGNIEMMLKAGVVGTNTQYISFSGGAGTNAAVRTVTAAYDARMDGARIGHIAVWPTYDSGGSLKYDVFEGPGDGFNNERAGTRIARLCEEEGVPYAVWGTTAEQVTLGPQRPMPLLDLLQEAADADGGILYEDRETLRLTYRDHTTRLGQGACVILPYGRCAELVHKTDDQRARNDVTASRPNGTSVRSVVTTGRLGTQAPPAGAGRYADSIERNVATDDLIGDAAGWATHLGTWEGARYPTVKLKMGALSDEEIRQVCLLDIGDRIRLTDPPAWLGPGDIDLIVEGSSEELAPENGPWDLELHCTPARPWDTAIVDDLTYGRLDTDGSALALAVDSTSTLVRIYTPAPNPAWVSGDRMLSTNPSFEGDAAGWSGNGGTLTRDNTTAMDGTWSAKLTPDGVSQYPSIQSGLIEVQAGGVYRVSSWMRCATARGLDLNVNWFTAASGYISTSSIGGAVAANTWEWRSGTVTAPATAAYAQLSPTVANYPPTTDIMWLDDIRLSTTDGTALDTQLITNTSFEANTAGWVGSGGTLTRVNSQQRHGAWSAQFTPDGVTQYPGLQANKIPVTVGLTYRVSAWMRCANARVLDLNVNWVTISGAYVSTSNIAVNVAAGTWTYASGLVTAPATAAFAVVSPTVANYPPAGDVMHVDDIRFVIPADSGQFPFDILVGGEQMTVTAIDDQTSPQVATVTRSVNGVVKSHAAGTAVALAQPMYLSF